MEKVKRFYLIRCSCLCWVDFPSNTLTKTYSQVVNFRKCTITSNDYECAKMQQFAYHEE